MGNGYRNIDCDLIYSSYNPILRLLVVRHNLNKSTYRDVPEVYFIRHAMYDLKPDSMLIQFVLSPSKKEIEYNLSIDASSVARNPLISAFPTFELQKFAQLISYSRRGLWRIEKKSGCQVRVPRLCFVNYYRCKPFARDETALSSSATANQLQNKSSKSSKSFCSLNSKTHYAVNTVSADIVILNTKKLAKEVNNFVAVPRLISESLLEDIHIKCKGLTKQVNNIVAVPRWISEPLLEDSHIKYKRLGERGDEYHRPVTVDCCKIIILNIKGLTKRVNNAVAVPRLISTSLLEDNHTKYDSTSPNNATNLRLHSI
uniref:Uncharacterized protein n=1 Tax=Glossina pallidipes TaxID=7398 RepID=A0A1A9ZZX8_GLOPL